MNPLYKRGRVEAPIPPEDFEQQLAGLSFSVEHDRDVVRELHRLTFRGKSAETTELRLGGLPQGQLATLCRALPSYRHLRVLHVNGAQGVLPDAAAAARLAAALARLPSFAELDVQDCGVGEEVFQGLVPVIMMGGRNGVRIDAGYNPPVTLLRWCVKWHAVSARRKGVCRPEKWRGFINMAVRWPCEDCLNKNTALCKCIGAVSIVCILSPILLLVLAMFGLLGKHRL